MPTLSVFHHLLFKDFLDIYVLTFFAYHLYVWLHQTKAFKALVGLLGLGIIYSVAQFWGLFLDHLGFSNPLAGLNHPDHHFISG